MRFIRLSSDRVYILPFGPWNIYDRLLILEFATSNISAFAVKAICFSEKTKAKQTHQQGISYLPQITCRADSFHPFAYKNLILCHDASASIRRETNQTHWIRATEESNLTPHPGWPLCIDNSVPKVGFFL